MVEGQYYRVAKALADPRRVQILEAIASAGEISCGEIASKFPIGQPTVSHHVKLLAEAGLVQVRREGQHGYFRACPEVLEHYVAELKRRLGMRAAVKRTTAKDTGSL